MLPNTPQGILSRQWAVTGSESRRQDQPQAGPSTTRGNAMEIPLPPVLDDRLRVDRQRRLVQKNLLGWVVNEDAGWDQAADEIGLALAGLD